MKKKLILSWLTLMAITTTGMVFAQEERRDDGGDDDEMAEEGEGREKGDGKGKGKDSIPPLAIRIFRHLDENEDGALSRRELAEARPLQDKSHSEIRKIFEKKDLNEDGEIGPKEFAKTFHPGLFVGKGHKGDRGPKGKGKGKGGKGGGGGE
jgi:hypothetical protein